MKKALTVLCVVILLLTVTSMPSLAKNTNRQPGGVPAFLIGCCWGLRVGTEWNEGADLHWREWCMLIPYVNIVLGIWNGIDCYNGITAHEWAAQNGANWY